MRIIIPITIVFLLFFHLKGFSQNQTSSSSQISFIGNISYIQESTIDLSHQNKMKWINGTPKITTEDGDVLITFKLAKYKNPINEEEKGYYAISNLEVINQYQQYQVFPELVEGLGRQKNKEVTIRLINGADNANLKFLVDKVLFKFTIERFPYKSYSGKILELFTTQVTCFDEPKLELGWTIVQGIALASGGYLIGKGIYEKNEVQENFQNNYLNPIVPSGGIDNDFRENQEEFRDKLIAQDDEGTDKINFGIALLAIDALWSIHRFSTHKKRKKLYHAQPCIEERNSVSFKPFIETNSLRSSTSTIGLSLTYTFK